MLASRPAICGLNWVRVKTRLQHKSALQTPKDGGLPPTTPLNGATSPKTVVPAKAGTKVCLPTTAMTRAHGMHRTVIPACAGMTF